MAARASSARLPVTKLPVSGNYGASRHKARGAGEIRFLVNLLRAKIEPAGMLAILGLPAGRVRIPSRYRMESGDEAIHRPRLKPGCYRQPRVGDVAHGPRFDGLFCKKSRGPRVV